MARSSIDVSARRGRWIARSRRAASFSKRRMHRLCRRTPPDYGPKPVALPSFPIGQEILPIALVAIFAGAATILAVALMAAVRTDTAHGRISRRLSLYTLTGRQPQKQAETTSTSVFGSSAIARSAVELAGRVVARPRIESALATRLDSAGLLLKPAEWTLIQIASGLLRRAATTAAVRGQHPCRPAWPQCLASPVRRSISCSSGLAGRMRSSRSCRRPSSSWPAACRSATHFRRPSTLLSAREVNRSAASSIARSSRQGWACRSRTHSRLLRDVSAART